MASNRLVLAACLTSAAACSQQGALSFIETGIVDTHQPSDTSLPPKRAPYNVLFVVWDDVGVEHLARYPDAPGTPVATPVFDQLADDGLLFERAWAYPVCSPTRASILTGRHPYRHGVGRVLRETDPRGLPYEELLLPEVLDADPAWNGSHAAIGKWHLGALSQDAGNNPLLHGFGAHYGPLFNPGNYAEWIKNVNGRLERRTGYLTADTVEDAQTEIDRLPEPWFLWVAFNVPHRPFHIPPEGTFSTPADPKDQVSKYRAMVESADYFTGELLAHLSPELRERTMIVVLGDNGTPGEVTGQTLPAQQAKTSVYEGGVRVPLVISGPAVTDPGRRTDALVQVTDLFPTTLDWAGTPLPNITIDGLSLTPLLNNETTVHHSTVYTERFERLGAPQRGYRDRAIRDDRFKLISLSGGLQLFDLSTNWLEQQDLLATRPLSPDAEAALQRLSDALDAHDQP